MILKQFYPAQLTLMNYGQVSRQQEESPLGYLPFILAITIDGSLGKKAIEDHDVSAGPAEYLD